MILNIKFSFVFILSAFYVYLGSGQIVKGKVYDNGTKEILLFANLTFTDSLNKEVHCDTNLDGEYTIDLQKFGTYKIAIQFSL